MSTLRGLPWWTITPLSIAVALTGVAIDTTGGGQLGTAFTVLFFTGCVAACLVAARKAVFVAGIQPPIIMTILVPLVYMLSGETGGAGSFSRTQIIGAVLPLVTRFPLMAVTTIVTVVVCLMRAFVLEPRRGRDRTRRHRHRAPAHRATNHTSGRRQTDQDIDHRRGEATRRSRRSTPPPRL